MLRTRQVEQRNERLSKQGRLPCVWRFAVYGDGKGSLYHKEVTVPHLYSMRLRDDVSREDKQRQVDLILALGDLVSHGAGPGSLALDWPQFHAETGYLLEAIPYFPLPGNHEYLGRNAHGRTDKRYNSLDAYKRFFQLPEESGSEAYYKVEYRNAVFIMLATWGEDLWPGASIALIRLVRLVGPATWAWTIKNW